MPQGNDHDATSVAAATMAASAGTARDVPRARLDAECLALLDQHIAQLAAQPDRAGAVDEYYASHRLRFAHTLPLVPRASGAGRALEIGATPFLQVALHHVLGYGFVAGTDVSPRIEDKIYRRTIEIAGRRTENLTLSLDIENDILPFPDGSLDLVLCCEVIEHLDIDPMFMLAEVNRTSADGATLVITTPNCCSARNVAKILQGWRPHFHMQYTRSRSRYRHNFEYDIHALVALVEAAGFTVTQATSHDVFEAPMPEVLDMLARQGMPTEFRGDGLFVQARKTGPVTDRWPAAMYVA